MNYEYEYYMSLETREIVYVYEVKDDTVYYESEDGTIKDEDSIYDFRDRYVPV